MRSNIEIKAGASNLPRLKKLVEGLSDSPCLVLHHEDVFFNTESGRLKLRIFTGDYGELIYYERENLSGPKQSKYAISSTIEPVKLHAVLSAALGIRIVVRKIRLVYNVGQMRIHLDEVDGLGSFIELEFVLRPNQDIEEGFKITRDIMKSLEISDEDLIAESYADLLESRG